MAQVSAKIVEPHRDGARQLGIDVAAAEAGLSFAGQAAEPWVGWGELVTFAERVMDGMGPEEERRLASTVLEANDLVVLGARVLPTFRSALRLLWRHSEAAATHLHWAADELPDRIQLECTMAPEVTPHSERFFRLLHLQCRCFATYFGLPSAPSQLIELTGYGVVFQVEAPTTDLDHALEAGDREVDRASQEFIAMFRERMERPRGPAIPSVERAQSRLGLTRTEARIAIALAEGLDLKQIAAGMGITVHTVRSHLRSVYAKTGANSQARLVGLVLLES